MHILVTGGAGFIGSNFVHRTLLTRPDYSITVFDALTYAGRLSNLEGASDYGNRYNFIQGDIRDSIAVNQVMAGVDAVVHFAAESHNDNSLHDPGKFIETNINGTFNLIQAAVKFGVRFHHVSTDEVFGDLPLEGTQKFTRDTPYSPSSPYSSSKAASDHLVRAWHRSFGLQATISNCSNNYGPRQHEEKFIPRSILLVASGGRPKVYGNGLNIRDWIHVDDHTDGVLLSLERGEPGSTYLLGSDGQRSNLQVLKAILEIMGKPADYLDFVPDRTGHDLRYAIDPSETAKELGWVPLHTDFENSLVEVVEHYKSLDLGTLKLSLADHSSNH
jgi:dTDP-glucose 4,6-dehydratase